MNADQGVDKPSAWLVEEAENGRRNGRSLSPFKYGETCYKLNEKYGIENKCQENLLDF